MKNLKVLLRKVILKNRMKVVRTRRLVKKMVSAVSVMSFIKLRLRKVILKNRMKVVRTNER